MQEHIKVGREYPRSTTHTTLLASASTTRSSSSRSTPTTPADFLDLVQRLRDDRGVALHPARHAEFTCIACSLERALNALDGEPSPARAANPIRHAAADFDEVRDITIIGAGPVGLCDGVLGRDARGHSRIIDSLPSSAASSPRSTRRSGSSTCPGTQVLAKDLVELLRRQALEQFDVPVHLETTAETITWEDDVVVAPHRQRRAALAHGDRRGRPRRVRAQEAAGLRHDPVGGPRRPLSRRPESDVRGQAGDDRRRRRLRLRLGDQPARHGRARWRSCTAARVPRARGRRSGRSWTRPARRARSPRARSRSRTSSATATSSASVVPLRGRAQEVELGVDAILLQLGFKTALGPLKDWGFESPRGRSRRPVMKTSLERVWACGDITTFDGKLS